MLSDISIQKALQVTSAINSRDLTVITAVNSPLGVCVDATDMVLEPSFVANPVMAISAASRVNPEFPAQVQHGSDMEMQAREIATTVLGSLNLIKTEVFPLVDRIMKKVDAYQDQRVKELPINKAIEYVVPKEIYFSSWLANEANRFRGTAGNDNGLGSTMRRNLTMGVTSEWFVGIINQLPIPESLKSEVAKLVPNYDVESVLFKEAYYGTGTYELYSNDTALLTFLLLMATAAGNHPTISTATLSAEERLEISRGQAFYAALLKRQMAELLDDKDNANLVIRWDTEGADTLYLRWNTYEKFIANGGSKDSLIGYALTYNSYRQVNQAVITDPDGGKSAYDRAAKVYNNDGFAVEPSIIKQLVHNAIFEYYEDFASANPDFKERQSAKVAELTQYMKNNTYMRGTSLEDYIAYTVCNTVGKAVDATTVYGYMKNYLDSDDSNTPDMAFEMARIELISAYVANMMSVCRS